MSPAETVEAFMIALESKDFEKARGMLADDFLFSGWTPQPLDTYGFMNVMQGLREGIPNLSYHYEAVESTGDVEGVGEVKATIKVTGTQTDGFILPALGLPPIPQTARSISLPQEHWIFTLENGKIARITTERVSGGGIQGLLRQLGIEIPLVGQ